MALFPRVLFVTVLACSAVVPFVGRHTAKAYPAVAPVDSGEHLFLRPHKRFGPMSSGPGRLTGASSEIAQSWRDPDRDAPPAPYLPPNLLRKGHLGYNPNTQRIQPFLEPMSHVHNGQASSTSTHSNPQLSRMSHSPVFQSQNGGSPGFVAPHNGNSKPWSPPIIRKLSHERPVPERSASQPESRSEGKTEWQSPDNSPESFRSRGYWSSQTYSKGHPSDNRETSAVRTSKFPGFLNQRTFVASSVSSGKHSSAPESQKWTSPIVQSSQDEFPANGNEKTSYKRVQSSLLWRSQTSDAHHPNLQQNAYEGQGFDQQTRPNFIRTSKRDHPASVIIRAPQKNTLRPFEGTDGVDRDAKSGLADISRRNENGQQMGSFNLNKGLPTWPALKKNSQSSIISKETNLESSSYRLVRPMRLQKYSFEQVMAPKRSQDIFRLSSSEFLDTTTQISPMQESGSLNTDDITVQKSDALSGAGENGEKVELKSPVKSEDVSKSVSHGNTEAEDNAAKDLKYKAVTYDDIIGSASFTSVTPAKTVQDEAHFEQSATTTTAIADTVNTSQTNVEKAADFKRGEAETELGISDWSVSEEETKAKSVPREPPSDPEENIESDTLLELDYLRTSTGNVSFQSLNLNL